APGFYTVRVVGAAVPGEAELATQGFALVVSGALAACTTAGPPSGVAVTGSTPTTIGLGWEPVTGAVGYEILRNASSCGEPMAQDRKVVVSAQETSHVDGTVEPGETYHYTVRAVMSPGCRTADSSCVAAAAPRESGPAPVPDGTIGQPMIASRLDGAGSSLGVQWDVLTCPAPGYHLLWGDLAAVATQTVAGGACGLSGGHYEWTSVPPGDLWFLIVSDDGLTVEGSWGGRTDGQPRGGGV